MVFQSFDCVTDVLYLNPACHMITSRIITYKNCHSYAEKTRRLFACGVHTPNVQSLEELHFFSKAAVLGVIFNITSILQMCFLPLVRSHHALEQQCIKHRFTPWIAPETLNDCIEVRLGGRLREAFVRIWFPVMETICPLCFHCGKPGWYSFPKYLSWNIKSTHLTDF